MSATNNNPLPDENITLAPTAEKIVKEKTPDNTVYVTLGTFRARDAYVRAIRRKAARHLTDWENAVLWAAATEVIPEPNIIFKT